MKSKILFLTATLALITSLSFLVFAALKDEREIDDLIYQVGNFKVSLDGEIVDDFLIPGVNIVATPITLKNEGNITIDLRLKLIIQLNGNEFNDFEKAPVDDSDVSANDFNTDDFTYSEGYYYLNNGLEAGISINIISSLILDGYKVQSAQSNQIFKITIYVDAKQQGSATWTNLGNNFIEN